MDGVSLVEETLDYIQSLRAQVETSSLQQNKHSKCFEFVTDHGLFLQLFHLLLLQLDFLLFDYFLLPILRNNLSHRIINLF